MQDINIYKNNYLIIGGPNTRKSEVARYLSKKLNINLINLNKDKYMYLEDFTDFDINKYYNLIEHKGELIGLSYIHKYEMKHLEYVLDNINSNVVIDFSNTYLIIDDNKLINRIKMFENIVLLYKDIKEYKSILDSKLYRNKLLRDISTIKINVDNKNIDDIIKEIISHKDFKEVL